MTISEESLQDLERALKRDFIGTDKISHDTEFYSDSFGEYLNEYDTEELRLCRISKTIDDIYFFFCMAYDEDEPEPDEVLAIEFYFNENGLITNIIAVCEQ